MKILTVIGARPQFVKAAVLSRIIKNRSDISEVLLHTGQHYDEKMSDIFFTEMDIPTPKYNLNINGLGHGAMTGQMLEGIEEVLLKEKPDYLLVYGDTNSTIAGALAAKKIHIKVAHVEAGLRSFNMRMPEEINRILTDRISDKLFAPTSTAVENLKREGYDNIAAEVILSGDVMQDAALYYATYSAQKSNIIAEQKLDKFILATIHRQENTDDPARLKNIVEAVNQVNEKIPVVLPLHPRTTGVIQKMGLKLNCIVILPVGYFDMIELLKKCSLVLTDSGGLQKEAYFFNKNCVTMRDETEWVELVKAGVNVLVGADTKKIVEGVEQMLNKSSRFDASLYGGGKAGETIVNSLLK
ncbi:MAG: non-hydrolyzing UDP-N-acetylglucosamine 2-epimerase [Flavobacteriales bacterium]